MKGDLCYGAEGALLKTGSGASMEALTAAVLLGSRIPVVLCASSPSSTFCLSTNCFIFLQDILGYLFYLR